MYGILNDHAIKLRAEISGGGNGSIYTIKVIATDMNGTKDTAIATVTVPKSMGHRERENIYVSVFPNPSPNYFYVTVNTKSSEKIRVRIFNIRGML